MKREEGLARIKERKDPWDMIVIGGGATGLGIALDAATRNYDVLLVEQHDLAKGTSSRSTKLIHGGVRYLQQGDISMVYEALQERGFMYQNAPHLVQDLSFIIPTYDWWDGPYYGLGLKLYDMMAGRLGLGSSQMISKEEVVKAIPTIEKRGLRGGVLYHDGQFDDARMAVSLALTASDYGACIVNYMKVTGFIKDKDILRGVKLFDEEESEEYEAQARTIINATGVFVEDLIQMDQGSGLNLIRPSQGIHLTLDKKFLPGQHAMLIPQTSDGRILFAIPWKDHVVMGTTDTIVNKAELEPQAKKEEISFILDNASKFFTNKPDYTDIKSVFAGLRPLAAPKDKLQKTKEISRNHQIMVSKSGLISVIGGKWTTYRKMAKDTVEIAIEVANLPKRPCITENILIHGYSRNIDVSDPLHVYGSYIAKINEIEQNEDMYKGYLSEKLRIKKSQVAWAIRHEMARTVEDILARRTRALFLDINETRKVTYITAELLANELDYDQNWQKQQISNFMAVTDKYLNF